MVFPTINSPKTTTGTTFGGDVMNKVMQLLGGANIAGTDPTNKPSISTETRFYSGKFILFDYDFSNEIKFFTPQLTNNVSVSFPDNLSISALNEITFNLVPQILQNKTIDTANNVITNIRNSNIATDAAIAWTKVSKAGSGLADIESVNLTGLANNVSLKWDSATSKWIVYALGSLIGEVNTMSNLTGTAGAVGLYKQKSGVNFEMKKLNVASASITITDDTSNNEVDVGLADATTSLKGGVLLGTSSDTAANKVVQTNDTRLTDSRPPTGHATSHKTGGSDSIKLNELAAPTTNVTALNTSTTFNGLAPMLNGLPTYYLDGTGSYSIPSAASGLLDTGTLVRGVTNKSGNGSTKVFTIAHGYSGTPVSYLVNATSVDAFGAFTIAVDATNITLTYQVAPPTGTNNLTYSWLVMSSGTGSAAGEANTSSSVGTGLAWTKAKSGVNLPFRSFIAGSSKISLGDNTNDITIDVAQANLAIAWSQLTSVPSTLVKTDQANVFGDFLQTFRSSDVKIMNPANTFGTILVNSAITTANKNLTLPLLTADDTVAVLALAQTFTNKTLTNPTIDSKKSGSFSLTVPTLTANDTMMGRNTTDTQTNKTLTAPIINLIRNSGFDFTVPTLTANDTIMGRNTQDTQTNKTIVLASNTITDTSSAAGDLAVHNGTRYVRLAKGTEGTFVGVSGGSVGYFTPATGSGGTLPDGSNIPTTGRWGCMWGGTSRDRGIFNITTTGTIAYEISSPTEAITTLATDGTDDSIAEIRTSDIWSRQSNVVFRAKWALKSSTNSTVMIGFSTQSALLTGTNHDTPLDNASGVMITTSLDTESLYQISRNDGDATTNKVATAVASNNTTAHTCEISINTTNVTVTLDSETPQVYTTEIPALTTGMRIYAHIEEIGSSIKTLSVYRLQATCL